MPESKPVSQTDRSVSTLVQITSRCGSVRGPSHGYQPPDLIELHLEAHQRVVQVEWRRGHDYRTRKTVDWTWTVWIESRVGGDDA